MEDSGKEAGIATSILDRNTSRREVLRGLGKAAVAAVAGFAAGRASVPTTQPLTPTPVEAAVLPKISSLSAEPNNTTAAPPALTKIPVLDIKEQETEKKDIEKELLNEMLGLEPNTPQRNIKEAICVAKITEYIADTKNFSPFEALAKINQGFTAVASFQQRTSLTHLRAEVKKDQGEKLEDFERKWGEKENINPQSLLDCKKAYPKARRILIKIFPDKDPDKLMINLGGLAKLLQTETGGCLSSSPLSYLLSHIGEQSAMKHINNTRDAFPDDPAALEELARKMSLDTGLNIQAAKIPGSMRGENDLSGGAIGPQIMPKNALEIYNNAEAAGEKINIFEPVDAAVAGIIFLAMRGYERGNLEAIMKALKRWNPKLDQMNTVYKAAIDFWDASQR